MLRRPESLQGARAHTEDGEGGHQRGQGARNGQDCRNHTDQPTKKQANSHQSYADETSSENRIPIQ